MVDGEGAEHVMMVRYSSRAVPTPLPPRKKPPTRKAVAMPGGGQKREGIRVGTRVREGQRGSESGRDWRRRRRGGSMGVMAGEGVA